MVIVTSVSHVAVNFGQPDQEQLSRLTASEAREYLDAGEFPKGSMGPKIEAALSFLEHGGSEVLVTSPEELGRALDGDSGTRIVP